MFNKDDILKYTTEYVADNIIKSIKEYADKIAEPDDQDDYDMILRDKTKEIMNALEDSNGYLKEHLENSPDDSLHIVNWKAAELIPNNWKRTIEREEYTQDKMKNIKATDMYVCRHCKGNRFSFTHMQTRSADEPTDLFVTCIECNTVMKNPTFIKKKK